MPKKKPALLSEIVIRRAPPQLDRSDAVWRLRDVVLEAIIPQNQTIRHRNVMLAAFLGGVAALLLAAGFTLWWTYPAFWPYAAKHQVQQNAPQTSGALAELLSTDTMPISAVEAEAINAARADEVLKLTSARPFVLPLAGADGIPAGGDALRCLTQAVYYEAASESDSGQRAVAQVVLNRMRHSAFPKSVCGVVYQGWQRPTGCQFSFTCDGSLARKPSAFGWARAQRVAAASLAGWVEPSVGLATHYHANYVVPYWASSLDKAKTIGAHLFYVMRGGNSRPAAFAGRYDPSTETLPGAQLTDVELLPVEGLDVLDDLISRSTAPSNRTAVREDGRGTLVVPSAQRGAMTVNPDTAPRADENKGKLGADERAGTLIPK